MTISNNDPEVIFNTLQTAGAPKVPVSVYWAGTDISSITGPTPFVDISKTANRGSNGNVETVTNTITLTGKIVRLLDVEGETRQLTPDQKGIVGLLAATTELQRLFSECSTGDLEIKCNPNNGNPYTIYSATGVKFSSINFEKNEDRWNKIIDFTVSLESQTGTNPDDPTEQVSDKSDTWSIEPLDEVVYSRFIVPVSQKAEYSSPYMKPRAPSVGNPVPAQSVQGVGIGAENTLQIMSVPQFRVTRRLSARGLKSPPKPTTFSKSGCLESISVSGSVNQNTSYLSAKLWVEKQLKLAFNGVLATGGEPYFTKTPAISNFDTTWLYNHTRSTNIDIYQGTYEATDTWIAMPTGMPYTETYNIESSTSQEYIRTVRVAGNIQGLSFTPISVMDGTNGPLPTGTGNNNPIDLSFSLIEPPSATIPPYNLLDVSGVNSSITNMRNSKYINALNGWLLDIKPYLYRRACFAANTPDRQKPYVDPALVNPPQPPENPSFAKETLLSVIPVSTSEGHDTKKGTISYSYEFNNRFTIISGVLSENITITDDGPADVVAETQIPGRALGPVLQKTGNTATRKTVNIEVTVMPPTDINGFVLNNRSCPLYTGGYIYNTINKLIEGIKPFGSTFQDVYLFGDYAFSKNPFGNVFVSSDQQSWTPTQGRYSRSVSWTYQQCSNNRFYLDH